MKTKGIILILSTLLFLTGCTAQVAQKRTKLSNFTNDFGTGIELLVDYVSDGKRTFVVLIGDNKRGRNIRVWMSTAHRNADTEVINRAVVHSGSKRKFEKNFRLSIPGAGITETITFQVYGEKGKLLMESKPIINHSLQGGTS